MEYSTAAPKDRLEVYKAMLKRIFNKTNLGFCITAYLACEIYVYDEKGKYTMEQLPELLAYKPEGIYSAYWFSLDESGNEKRIAILKEIIQNMTNDLLQS